MYHCLIRDKTKNNLNPCYFPHDLITIIFFLFSLLPSSLYLIPNMNLVIFCCCTCLFFLYILKHMYTFMNNDSIVWQLCNILIIIYCMFLTTVFSQYYTCEIYTVHIYICNPLCRFFFFPAQLTIGYFGYFKTFTLPKRSSNEHSGTCHCLRDDLRQCFPIFCSMQ